MSVLHRRIAAAAALSAATALTVTIAPAADAAGAYFSSCAYLHRAFPTGVAKSYAAAQYQVIHHHRMPSYSAHAQQTYWRNYTRLDRDRDGSACEIY